MKNCGIILTNSWRIQEEAIALCTQETCPLYVPLHREACGGQCGLCTSGLAQKKAILEKMKTKLERPGTLPRMSHHGDNMAAERMARSIKKR
jgi:UDP-N-acetylglucosamine 2-epimerase